MNSRASYDIYPFPKGNCTTGNILKGGWFINFRPNGVIGILIFSIIMHLSKTQHTAPGAPGATKMW